MFASAAREVVFSNPEVVRRVNKEFIPVALKAAMVNSPPEGTEGKLLAEIARSRPAPQGICTVNSKGKVLAWSLGFENRQSILEFLDHVSARFQLVRDATSDVTAERYQRFPTMKLPDVPDSNVAIEFPNKHGPSEKCPLAVEMEEGTLDGRVIGRALDEDGEPRARTELQENYMEARIQIPRAVQREFLRAMDHAMEKSGSFTVPEAFADALVTPSYLGQLDVAPAGHLPRSVSTKFKIALGGEIVKTDESNVTLVRIDGDSDLRGKKDPQFVAQDGWSWSHDVALDWYGFVRIENEQITEVVLTAKGNERLVWEHTKFKMWTEPDPQNMMAGHGIDFDGRSIYGIRLQRHMAK